MKKNEVKIGGLYVAKVSGKLVTVRISDTSRYGGWDAVNTATGKRIRIASAGRLRGVAKRAAKAKTPEAAEATKGAKAEKVTDVAEAAKVEQHDDRDLDTTPRSELTLEESTKLEKVRAAKTKKTKAAKGEKKPKRVSALDAAAQVLAKADKPMRAQELIAAMAEQGLWSSPNGKTPHATLYAAMMREARDKGTASRFHKVDRGMFQFNLSACIHAQAGKAGA